MTDSTPEPDEERPDFEEVVEALRKVDPKGLSATTRHGAARPG